MNDLIEVESDVRVLYTFRTEGRLYGIDATQIREIAAPTALTPVPQTPEAVRGLANLRSRVYLVVDVRPMLGLAPVEPVPESRLIILKPHIAESLGMFVEVGGDIVRVSARRIEDTQTPTGGDAANEHDRGPDLVVGICKLDNELVNIIDSTRVVESLAALMR